MISLVQPTSGDITELLRRWNEGDRRSLDALVTALLPQLRRIPHRLAVQKRSGTLDTTALAHELYIRFANRCPGACNREHLLALSALTMQHVLVDHARRHFRKKRGDGAGHLVLEEATALTEPQLEQVLIIDDALRRLEKEDARRADVFRMRFFSGLAVREVAEAMNLSENTVIRDWSAACSYLREQIQGKHRQAV